MNKNEINKKIQELNDKNQDIFTEIAKLEQQLSMVDSAEIIKVLALFNYDFRANALELYEKKHNDNECWKAFDAAWSHRHHDEIYIEENILLRVDDSDIRIIYRPADIKNVKCDGYETDMRMLAAFAKKHNLVITYDNQERKIKQYADSMKNAQEEMYFFKKAMCE